MLNDLEYRDNAVSGGRKESQELASNLLKGYVRVVHYFLPQIHVHIKGVVFSPMNNMYTNEQNRM